jgi:hypothetical protein
MKRVVIGASLLLIVFAMAGLRSGRAQQASPAGQESNNGAPPPANPLKVAILHWYQANRTTAFKVGKQPYWVAFDGANIWSANYEDNTVTKLQANDGENLGTFPVGEEPDIVAFDGASIWVGNYGDGTVSKLRASDGKNLGTFTTGREPSGLAFDGENMWVANAGDGDVVKLRAKDGKNLGTFGGGGSGELAFDGTYIWVTQGNTVQRLKEDGSEAGTFKVGSQPIGIAYDGANIWVANNSSGTVSKLRAKDGTNLGAFKYPGSPYGVAFDGANIWVSGSPYVVEYRDADGAQIGGMFHIEGSSTAGIAFDGANIWVAATYNNAVNKM